MSVPKCRCHHIMFDHLLDSDGQWGECMYCECIEFDEVMSEGEEWQRSHRR